MTQLSIEKIMSFMHENIQSLNNSKYFAGLVMIMLNIGSKYISVNFSKTIEETLKSGISRQLLIFSIAWMGTRDIYSSIIITASFTILSEYMFNEESVLCVIPYQYRVLANLADTNKDGIISSEEMDNAINVLEKAKKISNKPA